MTTIVPLKDRILVERVNEEPKTAGGIIIPDSAQEKPQQAVVVAVGSGSRDEKGNLIPLEVKIGDKVMFAKWAGSEIKIDGKDLLVMKESDVIAIIK